MEKTYASERVTVNDVEMSTSGGGWDWDQRSKPKQGPSRKPTLETGPSIPISQLTIIEWNKEICIYKKKRIWGALLWKWQWQRLILLIFIKSNKAAKNNYNQIQISFHAIHFAGITKLILMEFWTNYQTKRIIRWGFLVFTSDETIISLTWTMSI